MNCKLNVKKSYSLFAQNPRVDLNSKLFRWNTVILKTASGSEL